MLRRLAALALGAVSVARAQQSGSLARTAVDSAIQRARSLSEQGNAVASRRILDSLMRATAADSSTYIEALYWRAALAPAAVDAERDYGRILIEAPLSARAEDAMLQLAQLEQARGDRRAATDHLQRFMLSYQNNSARPRVAVSLVRLLFDQGQVARGCDALRMAREAIPAESLELRNQVEFYAPKCVVLDAAAPGTDSTARDTVEQRAAPAEPSAARSAAPRSESEAPSRTTSSSAFYSVQVAAYDSREPATRMARTLVSRGVEARVDGRARPFRVRVGKYGTRADAVKAARNLKAQGIAGFVTVVNAER